jgi:hypothetical protein
LNSPIVSRIGQVFIPVGDLAYSAEWYDRILGVENRRFGHGDLLYNVPIHGETKLTLDAHKLVTSNSAQPICFFWTEDIVATKKFLIENEVDVVEDIQNDGSLDFHVFRDPDDNLLMDCEPKTDENRRRAGFLNQEN